MKWWHCRHSWQELGYYQKKVVDNFGSGTYNALRAFEKANSLTVDGVALR